jgi:hypothetical protein
MNHEEKLEDIETNFANTLVKFAEEYREDDAPFFDALQADADKAAGYLIGEIDEVIKARTQDQQCIFRENPCVHCCTQDPFFYSNAEGWLHKGNGGVRCTWRNALVEAGYEVSE